MASSSPISVGDTATFTKTVGESDVYLFAGITGDFSPNHVNAEAMKSSPYGERIAHGALLVGYMSAASSSLLEKSSSTDSGETPVSLGYDRVRFLVAVVIGDTVTVSYTVTAFDAGERRSSADIKVTNQRGELVAVATHIMKWVAN